MRGKGTIGKMSQKWIPGAGCHFFRFFWIIGKTQFLLDGKNPSRHSMKTNGLGKVAEKSQGNYDGLTFCKNRRNVAKAVNHLPPFFI